MVNLRDAAAEGTKGLLQPLLKRFQVSLTWWGGIGLESRGVSEWMQLVLLGTRAPTLEICARACGGAVEVSPSTLCLQQWG